VTRQSAREVRARTHGAAAGIAALAWRRRVPDRSVQRDLDLGLSLPLSVRAGESG
jgi:hypothetical protein